MNENTTPTAAAAAAVIKLLRRAADEAPGGADDLGRGLPDPDPLNLTLGPYLADLGTVLRTFVLATIAVPIVIYGVMPRLHRARARLLAR